MKIIDYLGKEWKSNITFYDNEGVSATFYSNNYDFNVSVTHVADNEKIVKQEIDKYVEMNIEI